MANKRKQIRLDFPFGGLNRKASYQSQAPYTSPSALNVRLRESLEGRERGGSRPGLVASHSESLGSEVRMLAPMQLALGDGFTNFSDSFSGLSLAEGWSQASWADDVPSILPSSIASVDTSIDAGEAILDALSIDTSESYAVEVYFVPWAGEWHGKYRLYLRLDDTTPDIETDGVVIELTQTGATGAYTATLTSYLAGVDTVVDTATATVDVKPSWLTATVSGTTVTVYWQGTEIMSGTADAHTGVRVGFGMECTEDGGLCLANTFRVQYYSTGSVPVTRSMLYASAGGDLWYESAYGHMTVIASDLTVRDDTLLLGVQSGQKLYIADYGDVVATGTDGAVSGATLDSDTYADWTTLGILPDDMVVVISNGTGATVDGTYTIASVAAGAVTLDDAPGDGTCSFRIERAPKVLDPATNTLSIMAATAGQVPTGCPIIANYLNRTVFAGAETAPHVWYMSRVNDELDWDYAEEDEEAAVAGTSSTAGMPGDPITAWIVGSDDYSIIGCRNNLWRMRGDPASGGTLDAISHTIGIIGPKAWCLGPSGELIFLSLDGVYSLAPGGDTFPEPLSRDTLPREFLNIDANQVNAQLEYDTHGRGVHIYLTTEPSNTRVHWWMDLSYKSFWPVSLDADYEPTCTCVYQGSAIEDSGVILGCRDGTLRRYNDLAETDDGTAFDSYAMIGPIALASEGVSGRLMSIDATLDNYSGDVEWEVTCGNTAEAAVLAAASDSGTWSAGLNATARPACSGQALTLTLTGESGRSWAMESVVAVRRDAGPRRLA